MDFFDNDTRTYITPTDAIKFYQAAYLLPSKIIYSPFVISKIPKIIKRLKIKELPRLYQGTRLFCLNDEILFFQGLMGAPTTCYFLEKLIALGVTTVVFLGVAGAIQDDISIGDRIIVNEAVRLEGTSFHYLPARALCTSSEDLTRDLQVFHSKNGISFISGKIGSTDAPFRETYQLIEKLRLNNVLAIDMEVSAVFAVSTFRNVKISAMVIISDELKNNQWSGFQSDFYINPYLSSIEYLIEFLSER